jgi:hypothetical protein
MLGYMAANAVASVASNRASGKRRRPAPGYQARQARLMREVTRPCPPGRNPRAWAAMQRATGAR